MARVSSAPEDAFHFKGSFADGWGEVTGAQAVVFQFPPSKEGDKMGRAVGSQDPPSLYAEVTIQRYTDGDFAAKGAPQPEEVLLSIQKADKLSGELDLCHPGNYPDGNTEADPIDCGGSLGAAGNTLFAIKDGYQLNDKTKWMTFTQSLQEKGFKPQILKRTFFNDLIGLRAYFKTETRKKFRDDQTSDPTVFVVTEIKQFPYEKKTTAEPAARGTRGKATAAPAAPAAASAPGAPAVPGAPGAPTPAAASTNGTSASAEDIATAIVTVTLAPAKKGVTLNDEKRLRAEALMAMNKHKPAVPGDQKKAVTDLMTADWVMTTCLANDLIDISEDNKITFK